MSPGTSETIRHRAQISVDVQHEALPRSASLRITRTSDSGLGALAKPDPRLRQRLQQIRGVR